MAESVGSTTSAEATSIVYTEALQGTLQDEDGVEFPIPTARLLHHSEYPSDLREKEYDNVAFDRTDSPLTKKKMNHRRPGSAYLGTIFQETKQPNVIIAQKSASAQNLVPFPFQTQNIGHYSTVPHAQIEINDDGKGPEECTANVTIVPKRNSFRRTLYDLPCTICLSGDQVLQMACCLTLACVTCLKSHISIQLRAGTLAIECPSCDIILQDETVIEYLDESSERTFHLLRKMRQRQKGAAAAAHILQIDDAGDAEREAESGTAPTGADINLWAETENDRTGLSNARKCPNCEIYIQKKAGCFNMKCPICGTKFCYKCGMALPHDIAIHHKSTTVQVHRPLFTCHRCGDCCLKFSSYFVDCFSTSRWLLISKILLSSILLLVAVGVLIKLVGSPSSL